MTDAWVFPLGHSLGVFHPGRGGEPGYHRVRVGADVVNLSAGLARVWALAHGLPGALLPGSGQKWTRTALAGAVRALDEASGEADEGVAALVDTGALVEVADPETFVRRHRLQPLLMGLGVTAEEPDRYRIGLLDQPVATVDDVTFDLWEWSPRVADLLALSQVQELAAQLLGDDPDDALNRLFERLHVLLSYGCGYLDLAAAPAATST